MDTEKALHQFRENMFKTMQELQSESKGNMSLIPVFAAYVYLIKNLDAAMDSANSGS